MKISIEKDLRARISNWLADSEDPSLLEEGRRGIDVGTEVLLKEESFDIIYRINLLTMEAGEDG